MYVYRYGVYHAMAIRPKQLPNFIAKEQRQGSFQSSSKVSSARLSYAVSEAVWYIMVHLDY
jgi:hypothetical protein